MNSKELKKLLWAHGEKSESIGLSHIGVCKYHNGPLKSTF